MGFCLFGNVAVAAKAARRRGVARVLIMDWDVHHGNGTQRMFDDDPSVLYQSIHRHENGRFYPGTRYADASSVGCGAGKGYSINVPWQSAGAGDAEYIAAFTEVLMPIAYEFDPEVTLKKCQF